VLGSPQITPQLRERVTAGVLEEAGGRSVDALAAERDRLLLGLLRLRAEI